MTTDLLDADCVIQHLCNLKVITVVEWRNRHPDDQNYSVYFNSPFGKLPGDIFIQIIKRSGKYYISRSLIKVLAHRHLFNAENIYSNCAV